MPFFEIQADIFMGIESIQTQKDEWKYQKVFQEKALDNIFIVKFQNSTPGANIWSSNLIGKLMISQKMTIHMNHTNWDILEGSNLFLGGGGEVQIRG